MIAPVGRAAAAQRRIRALGTASSPQDGRRGGMRRVDTWVQGAGRRLRRLGGRAPDAVADRRMGRAAIVAAVSMALHPALAVPVGLTVWALPVLAARRQRRDHQAGVLAQLPDVVGLLRVAVTGGCSVRHALAAVTSAVDGPLVDALRTVLARADAGVRLVDALDDLGSLGGEVRPLLDALVAAERDGVALTPALERVAFEARTARRVRTERAARSLSVSLLFPLVCCVLPAFALLTVVPVVARAIPTLAP